MPNDPDKLRKMVRLALKEKAPKTYRELKRSRKLQKSLDDHCNAMMEGYRGWTSKTRR